MDTANCSGEYDLATPMFEFQKELTDQIVSLHYSDILKYCETNDTTELIIKSLEICVENCMLVASHPYLLIKHYMPKNFNTRDLPAKLAETSGKFSVLRNLVNVVQLNNLLHAKNVGIVMRNDPKTFDLTEALLLGSNGHKQILRYVGNSVKRESNKNSRGAYRDPRSTYLHLLPGDGGVTRFADELKNVKFDVLIALDGTVDTKGENMARWKSQNYRGDAAAAVVLKLVPMYSIEHCLQHYADAKDNKSRLYNLISSIVCLRDQVGNLLPDLFPIYNQNLSYLSHTFFDHVFHREVRAFPKWPLPELPNIPKFSATDVERSLLTEVVYHYTPYDSNDIGGEGSFKRKKSYYESKRLQSDYVSNPLKHDYASLSGIHNHHLLSHKPTKDPHIMTHMLLLKLNANYSQLKIIKEEFDCYINFNQPEKQRSFGRRVDEIKRSLTSIIEDCDHAEQRLQVTQKKITKRTEENECLRKDIKEQNAQLDSFLKLKDLESGSPKAEFVLQQLKMWQMQGEIKALMAKIKAKGEEKSYMTSELTSCETSIEQSNEQLKKAIEECKQLNEKIESAFEAEKLEVQKFQDVKRQKLSEIESAVTANEMLRQSLASTLKFLRDSSYIKKRKGRGLTPGR